MGRYDNIVKQFPALAGWQKADDQRVNRIITTYPSVPADYLEFLTQVGFGKSEFPTFRLYGGLSPATDVYGEGNRALSGVLLFGDDYQGFTSGYDVEWRVVVVHTSDGPVDVIFDTFESFVFDLFPFP